MKLDISEGRRLVEAMNEGETWIGTYYGCDERGLRWLKVNASRLLAIAEAAERMDKAHARSCAVNLNAASTDEELEAAVLDMRNSFARLREALGEDGT